MHFNDQNKVNSTSELDTEPKNQANLGPKSSENSSSKVFPKKKTNGFVKFLGITSFLVILTLAGVVASLFIPVSAQTLASRALDSLGFHAAALSVESLAKSNGNLLTYYSSIDPKNPDSCGNNWKNALRYTKDIKQISGNIYTETYFNNPNYRNEFSLNSYIQGAIDLENPKAEGEVSLNARANLDIIKKVALDYEAQEESLSFLKGKFDFSGTLLLVISQDSAAIKVPSVKLQIDDIFAGIASDDWYGQPTNLTDLQKEAVSEVSTEVREIIKSFNLESDVSENTWKTIFTESCKLIEKVEVQSPETKSFGPESRAISKEVRPIKIIFKENNATQSEESYKAILEAIKKDDKLRAYIKSLYPNLQRIAEAVDKISGSTESQTESTQESFEKAVDEAFNNLGVDDVKAADEFGSPSQQNPLDSSSLLTLSENGLKIKEISYFYLDQESLDFYAFENETQYLFEDKFYETQYGKEVKGKLKNLISDGITSKFTGYNAKYNGDAEKVQTVDSFKLAEDFYKDNQEQFENAFKAFQPEPTSN